MRLAEHISKAKPDHCDGVDLNSIYSEVRKDLSEMIIPTSKGSTTDPAAPNYFIEVTSRSQDGQRGRRQVGHDGVLGARGMHSLQNYRQQPMVYDGNAYTFGVTFHGLGNLNIYAIYMAAPSKDGGKPRYNITMIDSYLMTKLSEFLKGITACRNIRCLAKEYREDFVRRANQRVRQTSTPIPSISGDATNLPGNDNENPSDSGIDTGPQVSGDETDDSDDNSTVSAGGGQDAPSPRGDLDDESGSSDESQDEDQEVRGSVAEQIPNFAMSFTEVTMPSVEVGGHSLRARRRRRAETPDELPPKKKRRTRESS
ncbi:hypothetical protein VSDG_09271 [Cytospora chrysosperma]|uniref:Uncharacterized protein n=1 Tax=Cytospora chrysosperma TaxID=252740 RepID=A0A423VBA4_CYTCH|nr:hypothetical protein VSDG_09271 [Valsa sordida]